MANKTNTSVALIGLPEYEKVIINLIFKAAMSTPDRDNYYLLADSTSEKSADFLIVNGHDQTVLNSLDEHHNLATKIFVEKERPNDEHELYIQRPLIATRVLAVLDKAALLQKNIAQSESIADTSVGYYHATSPTADQNTEPQDNLDKTPSILTEEIEDKSSNSLIEKQTVYNRPIYETTDSLEQIMQTTYNRGDTQNNFERKLNELEVDFLPSTSNITDSDFTVSALEASELAIVHDEVLAHPGNESEVEQIVLSESDIVDETENDPISITEDHAIPIRKTVLVIDDSLSVRKQLEIELQYYNADVDFAEDAENAFQQLNSKTYDIVFLDVVLPDHDGFVICKSIKNNNAKKNTPVIMLTGKAGDVDKVKGALAGCDAYLTKPVGQETFQNIVNRYLEPIQLHS